MRKINEIFYSLQGEGYYTGTPSVFIRFSGCNLQCDFCDTEHESGVMMTDEEILKAVLVYPAHHVVLTGGEPSLWVDQPFINLLHQAGKYVCIETNGTRPLPKEIDWVTCSPKGAPIHLSHIDEVKVVYTGQDLEPYAQMEAKFHYLQPCSCKNTKEVIEVVLKDPRWRLSLQTHKIIGIQ